MRSSAVSARVRVCAVVALAACQGRVGDPVPQSPAPTAVDPPAARAPGQPGSLPPPLAIDEPGATQPSPENPCAIPAQKVWRLGPDELGATLAQLAPQAVTPSTISDRLRPYLPRAGRYGNAARAQNATTAYLDELLAISRELSAPFTANASALHACLSGAGAASDDCVRQAIAGFGLRAFRRPPTTAEEAALLAFFREQERSFGKMDAIAQLARRMVLSPATLFRWELGQRQSDGFHRLTDYETASALSYFLTGGPPDAELMNDARAGVLSRPADRERHAQRLIAGPARGVQRFFAEHLDVEGVAARELELPNARAVVKAMAEEPGRFVDEVLWRSTGTLGELLAGSFTMADPALAVHYGVTATAWQRVTPRDRVPGLLTMAAPLVMRNAATERGIFIREAILCQPPPQPPDVNTDLDEVKRELEKTAGRKLSYREVRERHVTDPACSSCHSLLDPLGFPFDAYDGTGRPRTMIEGFPVNTRGSVNGTESTDGPVTNAGELVRKLAGSNDVRRCFSRRVLEYAFGQPPAQAACFSRHLADAFVASGGKVLPLITGIVAHDAFVLRAPMDRN